MAVNMPKITIPFSGMAGGNNIRKELEEKNKERSKIFGFIGMDVYELYKEGKVDIQELEVHFEKMRELEQTIEELEVEKQRQELQSKGSSVCSCGRQLLMEDRFCPNCGKPVDNGMITCTCGKMVKSDLTFCSYCGRNLKEIAQSGQGQAEGNAPSDKYVECICGAKVPEGQFMCMECGRRIER